MVLRRRGVDDTKSLTVTMVTVSVTLTARQQDQDDFLQETSSLYPCVSICISKSTYKTFLCTSTLHKRFMYSFLVSARVHNPPECATPLVWVLSRQNFKLTSF